MPCPWQRYAESVVLVEYFEDSAAAFCISSGETHIVDAFPAELLKLMPPGAPIDAAALTAAFAATMGDPAEAWSAEVEAVLCRLEQMGIVAAGPV